LAAGPIPLPITLAALIQPPAVPLHNHGKQQRNFYYTIIGNAGSTTVTITAIATPTCSTTISSGNTVTFTVNALPAAVTASGGGTFCGSATVSGTNGGSGTVYYEGTTSGGTSTATPATSKLVSSSGTIIPRAISCRMLGNEGSVTVTINPLPTAVNRKRCRQFCNSTTITAANGGSGTIYYQGTTSGGTSTATPSASQTVSSSGTYYFVHGQLQDAGDTGKCKRY